MAITTPKEFFKRVLTKTKQGDSIIEKDIEVANKFNCFLQNDIAELYINCDSGNDSNDGFSELSPLKTLDKALSLVRDYGWASSHLYFMKSGDYIATNYKNIASCSIHFHSRDEGIKLIFRNESTAFKPAYDYTAFYGCHYNFGSTEEDSDGFNFIHRMSVIFQVPDTYTYKGKTYKTNNPYFENCSTVFNGCDIFSQNLDGSDRVDGCIGFAGGNVLLQQCRLRCMVLFSYTNAVMRNVSSVLQNNVLCAIRNTNSKVTYFNDLNQDLTPKWKFIASNVYRVNTQGHNITEALFTLVGSAEMNFVQLSNYQIANSDTSVDKINRIVNSRGGTIICADATLSSLNTYNQAGASQFTTIQDNFAQLSLINGHFNKSIHGNLVGS